MRSLLPPTRWAGRLAPRRPRPLRRPVIKGWSKLTYKNGQIVERRQTSGCSYGLCLAVGDGRRIYLALGHEQDGWTRPLAETVLLVVAAARRVPLAPSPRKRR
jgi:hypothetical protein